MLKLQCLSFLAILFSVAACAPINYEATYRPPSRHISAYSSSQPYTSPIQVTLYSDSTYLGVNFNTIHVVISDDQYIGIPVKNRRGRSSLIFAHYQHGNLHFDSNQNCQNLQGSTGYQYDKRWDKGHKYSHVNAGRDYDLTGFRLVIRNIPKMISLPKRALTTKTPTSFKEARQTVKHHPAQHDRNSTNKKALHHKQSKYVSGKVGVASKTSKRPKQASSYKYIENKAKVRVANASKPKKTVAPVILRDIARHDKVRNNMVAKRRSGRETLNKSVTKRSVKVQGNHAARGTELEQAKSQRKTISLTARTNKAVHDENFTGRGPASKKAKEAQSFQKQLARPQNKKQSHPKARNYQQVPEAFVIAYPQGRNKNNHAKKVR